MVCATLLPALVVAEEPPGLALLEYLGEWRGAGEEQGWSDPLELYAAGLLGEAGAASGDGSRQAANPEREAQ